MAAAALELLSVVSWFDESCPGCHARVLRAMDAYRRSAREPARFRDAALSLRHARGFEYHVHVTGGGVGVGVGGGGGGGGGSGGRVGTQRVRIGVMAQRLSVLTFANTVVNNAPSLDARVEARNDWLSLGLLSDCGRALDMYEPLARSLARHGEETRKCFLVCFY